MYNKNAEWRLSTSPIPMKRACILFWKWLVLFGRASCRQYLHTCWRFSMREINSCVSIGRSEGFWMMLKSCTTYRKDKSQTRPLSSRQWHQKETFIISSAPHNLLKIRQWTSQMCVLWRYYRLQTEVQELNVNSCIALQRPEDLSCLHSLGENTLLNKNKTLKNIYVKYIHKQ